jgi:hypothetical protein
MSDGTVLLWDLRPHDLPTPDRESKITPAKYWDELGSSNAQTAYRASWMLVEQSGSCSFLKTRLRPIPPPSPELVRHLIVDLEHENYDRREAASRQLIGMHELIAPQIQAAAKDARSPETRRRAARILARLADWRTTDAERLRTLRSIWLLQRIGTPEARAILELIATGAAQARETQDAKAALLSLRIREGK